MPKPKDAKQQACAPSSLILACYFAPVRQALYLLLSWEVQLNFSWNDVNKIGQNKVLSKAYVWFFLVPILAKFIALVESPIDFTAVADGLIFDLSLPFSWKLFYLSSLFVFLGNAIYFLWCPQIIKDYPTFLSFDIDGLGAKYLTDYAQRINCQIPNAEESIINNPSYDAGIKKDAIKTVFYTICEQEKMTKTKRKWLCLSMYALGFLCLLWVMVQNAVYVAQQI
ncbi:hypothetical protein RC083_10710 [Pseudoalteromonas haloplanktis]|uniref:Uncharacterized protein n=1 Tax=Pseudoalteromonas haloplanktis TaxID=228 RepID=A0ABU1BC28_PSEHA|nr:hypothetical protein [Pseudoalteromonas haloplanktis]MDQ9092059.1 hypothetical protein [Pseudoalteromonas haloplanktis]